MSSRRAKENRKEALKEAPPAQPRGGFLRWLPLLLALAVAAFAFLPALNGGFLTWDDDWNFLTNTAYRGLGPRQLRWMFTTFLGGPYQPITWLTFGLDYKLWGMEAYGYHLVNLLLHTLNAGLFYAVTLRLLRLGRPEAHEKHLRWGAAFAAIVFAAHPLRVESVAWITERRDVLSGAFYLASALFYLKAAGPEPGGLRGRRLAFSLCFYAAALLSKAIGVAFAFVLLALDVYPLKRLDLSPKTWLTPGARGVLKEKLPYLALGAAAGAVGYFGQWQASAMLPLAQFGPAQRLAQSAYGLAFYLWKTLLPVGLLPIYEAPDNFNPAALPFLASGAAVLALAAVIYALRRRLPALLTAAAVYLAFLAPVMGIVKMGVHFAADRYSYLACTGWAALAGAALACMLGAGGMTRELARIAAVLLAFVLVGMTRAQSALWRSSEVLWSYVVPRAPGSALAANNLGDVLFKQGRYDEAAAFYRKALDLRPDYAFISYNLANALTKQKNWAQAERQYLDALRLAPDFTVAHGNYGNLLTDLGRYNEAGEQYRAALKNAPGDPDMHYGLGDTFLHRGRLVEAQAAYEEALRLNPDIGGAAANLALALYRQKKWGQAERWFLEALRLKPELAAVRDNYGNLLLDLGRYNEALARYQEALQLEPRAETYNNIGAAMLRQGRAADAIPYFEQALSMKPEMAMARKSLAVARAHKDDKLKP
ncbi:MAG: hypothetical protein COT18_01230 [Elusimicrobia bacterium CG08_land_8_20_14_0_20_59_10]|nr:MAG: hypothetical protein COT18_01230 [Elusimicrobia bacterium CG08_land_8_20_14_0_20_59_10]